MFVLPHQKSVRTRELACRLLRMPLLDRLTGGTCHSRQLGKPWPWQGTALPAATWNAGRGTEQG